MRSILFKKIIASVSIFILLTIPVFPRLSSQETEVQKAISYLKTQTLDPWITMAQAAAGETNLDLNHLKEVSGNLATDYARTILALTAAGINPRTFGNIDFVAQLKSFYQSNQVGSPELLNDDFWGILALVSAGESPLNEIIENSKNFILANQNPDGGFSYALSGQSDTNDTAAAIMVLLEAGISSTHPAITNAVDYLKSSQNLDGGFPYVPGEESDSGSDSWVISAIYKLGQDPRNWQKGGQNPIDHLKSLQRSDGSFKWIASEDKGYPILTAYAVIALSQNYYPINRLHYLRIEGENNNICDTYVKAETALDIIENGSVLCSYTYFIEQTSWGPYLKKINQEESHDLIGWLYFVNYQIAMVGAADYILEPGDEVLWYFGEWGWRPTRLTLQKLQVEPGSNVEAKVEYFENSSFKPLAGASIYVNGQNFTTDNDGEADIIINNAGIYRVFSEKSGHIRSNSMSLLVGEGISQNVSLRAEIIPPSVPEIAFLIDKNQIDFGQLTPGAQADNQLLITNSGNLKIYLEGIVSGSQIFRENLSLDNFDWLDFSTIINAGSEKSVLVGLTVPGNWTDYGVKEGNLTFWAIAKAQ